MKTLVLKFQFDGTDFVGWQVQPGKRSLQGELTKAFYKRTGLKYKIIATGRTDAGVHGVSQIATIAIEEFAIPEKKIVPAINAFLPKDIKLIDAQIINKEYNARFDAIAREYSYFVTSDSSVFKQRYFSYYRDAQLKLELMNQAAKSVIGTHDFTAFSKVNNDLNNYICNVEYCHWNSINSTDIKLSIKSNRFVYSMVRCLVGTMIDIGKGKLGVEDMTKILISKDRSKCSKIAPANGLFFERAYFNEDYEILR
jgi:tRNA pseudouridine38-40 synthase